MGDIIRYPIWLLSSACITAGALTAVHHASAPPSFTNVEEWIRFEDEVIWYALALIIFWGQLLLWACQWWTRDRGWHIGLGMAFLVSGLALTLAFLVRSRAYDL